MAAAQSDTALIKGFFEMDLPTAKAEMTGPGAPTAAEKKQLAQGIRDGSLTYPDPEAA